jgi:hypothetical protein
MSRLSLYQAAEAFSLPMSWLYRRTRSLPVHREGKYLCFDARELLAWLRAEYEVVPAGEAMSDAD